MSHNKERQVTIFSPQKEDHILVTAKLGRNAPCICGSGKKQKKCCGEQREYYSKNLKKK